MLDDRALTHLRPRLEEELAKFLDPLRHANPFSRRLARIEGSGVNRQTAFETEHDFSSPKPALTAHHYEQSIVSPLPEGERGAGSNLSAR